MKATLRHHLFADDVNLLAKHNDSKEILFYWTSRGLVKK